MPNYVLTPSAVRKLRRALSAKPGNGGASLSPASMSPDGFPPPFAVRWAQRENNGQGAWVMWLPLKANLIIYDGNYQTPTGVTASQVLPNGWYTIDDAEEDSEKIYLVATITEGDSPSADFEFSTTPGQSSTGSNVTSVLVAQMAKDADTGARRVKQFVDSALLFGASGSGGGVDGKSAEVEVSSKAIQPTTGSPGGTRITITCYQVDNAGNKQKTDEESFDIMDGESSTLSDQIPKPVVLSTEAPKHGTSTEASRADHVHRLPNTVVDTVNEQTIDATKSFSAGKGITFISGGGQAFTLRGIGGTSNELALYAGSGGSSVGGNQILTATTSAVILGSTNLNNVRLRTGQTIKPEDMAESDGPRLANLKWVADYFLRVLYASAVAQTLAEGSAATASVTLAASQADGLKDTLRFEFGIPRGERGLPGNDGNDGASVVGATASDSRQIDGYTVTPITFLLSNNTTIGPIDVYAKNGASGSGTIDYISDIDWNTTSHTLRKRKRRLNLQTGQTTDLGWSTAASTTPISSII